MSIDWTDVREAASMLTTSTRTLEQVNVNYIKRRGGWGVTLTDPVGSYAFPLKDLIATRTP